uniref:Uncharacterized protein n=1 Tax=Salix viminalis TaxID=40686 RepID=A0A6N2LXD9_SALVM
MKNTLRKQQQKIDLARLITFRQPLPPPRPRSQVLRQQLHPGIADIQTRDHSCCFQASVNSISSMPSPVYQCKKAFLLNIAVNCSLTRLNISWMEVEFPMKTVTILRLLSHDIKNRINQLRTLSIMTFGPVISSARLSKHEVIRPKDLAIGTSPHTVHGARLEIHKHSARDKSSARCLVVINIDALQLKVRGSGVFSSRIDSMLSANNLPELGTDLVTALSSLNIKKKRQAG